jgi:Zn-dependent protease/CBS domain-containing protein
VKQSIHLGRVAGIPIGANWSVIVITVLITWILAAGVLPEMAPDQSPAAYVGVGVVAAGLFFASLVTHELAHALVARRYGVPVRAISLWMFGGVSELGSETSAPGEELRMAVAGPATSLGLSVLFSLAAVFATAVSLPELVVGALWWLALVNVGLGVFNLLPAYPMDGGRVLRAVLWARYGDRIRATQASARTGHWFAYGIIGVGVLLAVSGALVSGIWLMLIGWFLEGTSRAEGIAAVQQGILDLMRADQLMSAPAVTVSGDISVEHLVDAYVLGRHHSSFPVLDETGAPIGLVGLDQVRRILPADRPRTAVQAIAQPLAAVPVVAPEDTGSEVLARLSTDRANRALVIDERNRLVGIISNADLARAISVGSSGPTPTGRRSEQA